MTMTMTADATDPGDPSGPGSQHPAPAHPAPAPSEPPPAAAAPPIHSWMLPPEGAGEWIDANAGRMRAAYNESNRPDHLLWFAAINGVNRRSIVRAIGTIALAVLCEARIALRYTEEEYEALGREGQQALRIEVASGLEEVEIEPLRSAYGWGSDESATIDTAESKRLMTIGKAAQARKEALLDALREDVDAGRVSSTSDAHVYRLREAVGVDLSGFAAWAVVMADELPGARSPNDGPFDLAPWIGGERRWAYVARVAGELARMGGEAETAGLARDVITFDALPTARAWDTEAPGPRFIHSGVPRLTDPTDASCVVAMAHYLGQDEAVRASLEQLIEEIGTPESAAESRRYLDAAEANPEDWANNVITSLGEGLSSVPADEDDDAAWEAHDREVNARALTTLARRHPDIIDTLFEARAAKERILASAETPT